MQTFSFCYIPQTDGTVTGGGGKKAAIRGEAAELHGAWVSSHGQGTGVLPSTFSPCWPAPANLSSLI